MVKKRKWKRKIQEHSKPHQHSATGLSELCCYSPLACLSNFNECILLPLQIIPLLLPYPLLCLHNASLWIKVLTRLKSSQCFSNCRPFFPPHPLEREWVLGRRGEMWRDSSSTWMSGGLGWLGWKQCRDSSHVSLYSTAEEAVRTSHPDGIQFHLIKGERLKTDPEDEANRYLNARWDRIRLN